MAPVLDRYRPIALTVAAILVAVAVLPGATEGSEAAPASFDSAPPAGDVDEEPPDDVPDDVSGDVPAETTSSNQDDTPTTDAPSFTPPTPSFDSTGPATSSAGPPTAPSGPSSAPAGGFASDAEEAEPISIVEWAWASATGGTPVPHDIPEGSLPVGTLVGQPDKASYIRLTGDESQLVLTEMAEGRRGNAFEESPVQACQIVEDGWEPGENQSFDDSPEHDPDDCVSVAPQPDGTWSIELLQFASPTDGRGLALVPAPDAPIDFQVTFSSMTGG